VTSSTHQCLSQQLQKTPKAPTTQMRINDIDYRVAWKRFKKGTSFFVPCIRLEEGVESVKAVTRRLGYRVAIKIVIEDGIKGLRVWRIK
jgi:hypothetical protein